MKLFISKLLLVCLLFGCQTIENKADKIGKKEIKEISKFLQQPESELKIALGEPDEIRSEMIEAVPQPSRAERRRAQASD